MFTLSGFSWPHCGVTICLAFAKQSLWWCIVDYAVVIHWKTASWEVSAHAWRAQNVRFIARLNNLKLIKILLYMYACLTLFLRASQMNKYDYEICYFVDTIVVKALTFLDCGIMTFLYHVMHFTSKQVSFDNIRPFRLTRAIACAHVSTRANLSARAVCRTHEKSFSRKGLVHRIFFFQSFVYVYEHHLWVMRYMSIAYHRCRLRRAEGHPKRKIGFVVFLRVGF